jgi:hypothetical protein
MVTSNVRCRYKCKNEELIRGIERYVVSIYNKKDTDQEFVDF